MLGEEPSTLQSFSEMARARGLVPASRALLQEVRPATFEEAERLAIVPAAPLVQLDRLRAIDGMTVCFDSVVVPRERAPGLTDVDLSDRSLYVVLATEFGVSIQHSRYSVQAVSADERIARLLEIAPGAPVLVGREVASTQDRTPVLLGVNHYRGDAYRFATELVRTTPPGAPPA